ncbi:MAG: hypothetical protein KDD31_00315 [Muricauda sp.]|jgi:hypothetical protein|nr:hypothetical protein [Allomuricauda sp.]
MRGLVFIALFLAMLSASGQKLVKKAFIDSHIDFIQIDSQYCYRVDLKTARTDEVTVSASIEGEYAKDLLISIEESGTTALISAGFQPLFINPNDKLSAHKVVSIAIEVSVPEYMDVAIFGTNSDVYATGKYENLSVTLSDGRCTLTNVSETVEVLTQKGDIWLTIPNGDILAETSYGHIEDGIIPFGHNQFVLKSVEGNIHLIKTK